MLGYKSAIRNLHTPNTFTKIDGFDEIQNGRTYIAHDNKEKLQKFEYA